MHMRGDPGDMASRAVYADVVADVTGELCASLDAARRAGVRHVLADPGLGFAKTADQSAALFAALPRLAGLGVPLVVGASRKSFLAALTGRRGAPPALDRLDTSVAAAALAAWLGAHVVRVHDVKACRDAVLVADALRTASGGMCDAGFSGSTP
jgi:dihydropteroate synthase